MCVWEESEILIACRRVHETVVCIAFGSNAVPRDKITFQCWIQDEWDLQTTLFREKRPLEEEEKPSCQLPHMTSPPSSTNKTLNKKAKATFLPFS